MAKEESGILRLEPTGPALPGKIRRPLKIPVPHRRLLTGDIQWAWLDDGDDNYACVEAGGCS